MPSNLFLNDLTQATSAFGNLVGSLTQLHQTRVQVEGSRRQAELARMQEDFLAQADAPPLIDDGQGNMVRNPARMTTDNWRDRFTDYKSKVDSYMGNIADPAVRESVQAMFQEQTSAFNTRFGMQMANIEMVETQQEGELTLANYYDTGNIPALVETYKTLSSAQIYGPNKQKELYNKYLAPALYQSTAGELINQYEQDAAAQIAVDPEGAIFVGNSFQRSLQAVNGWSRTNADGTVETFAASQIRDIETGEMRDSTASERAGITAIIEAQQKAVDERVLARVKVYTDANSDPNSVPVDPSIVYSQVSSDIRNMTEDSQIVLSMELAKIGGRVQAADIVEYRDRLQVAYGRGISMGTAEALKKDFTEWFAENQGVDNVSELTGLARQEYDATVDKIDSWGRESADGRSRSEVAANADWVRLRYLEQESVGNGAISRSASVNKLRNYLAGVFASDPVGLASWVESKFKEIETMTEDNGLIGLAPEILLSSTVNESGMFATRAKDSKLFQDLRAQLNSGDGAFNAWYKTPRGRQVYTVVNDALSLTANQLEAEGGDPGDARKQELFAENLIVMSGIYEYANSTVRAPLIGSGTDTATDFQRSIEANAGNGVSVSRTVAGAAYYRSFQTALSQDLLRPQMTNGNILGTDGTIFRPADLAPGADGKIAFQKIITPTDDTYFVGTNRNGTRTLYAINPGSGNQGNKIVMQRFTREITSDAQLAEVLNNPNGDTYRNMWGTPVSSGSARNTETSATPASIESSRSVAASSFTAASNAFLSDNGTFSRMLESAARRAPPTAEEVATAKRAGVSNVDFSFDNTMASLNTSLNDSWESVNDTLTSSFQILTSTNNLSATEKASLARSGRASYDSMVSNANAIIARLTAPLNGRNTAPSVRAYLTNIRDNVQRNLEALQSRFATMEQLFPVISSTTNNGRGQ